MTNEKRYPLTPKQAAFFARHRQALLATEAAMRGALQLIAEERGLAGRVALSDDCAELIETEASDAAAGPVHPAAAGAANGALKELEQ